MTVVVIVFILAAAAASLWLRTKTDRLMHRAPLSAQLIFVGLLALVVILEVSDLVTEETLLAVLAPGFVIILVWGWLRHARSPHRQRWERTWAQVDKLITRDPAAADRALLEAYAADSAELEKLRILAPCDRRAARDFRAGVLREFRELRGSETTVGRFVKEGEAGADGLSLHLQKRRSKLEEDLAWVAQFLE